MPRKRVFSIHMTTGANSDTGMSKIIFIRRYRDDKPAGNHGYSLARHGWRLGPFLDGLEAVHETADVYEHRAYGGRLLYQAINIKGRYGADWSFDSLTPSAEVKPPFVFPEYTADDIWPRESDSDWPDEWD